MVEHLGDPDAVLIVDDTGFLKKGVRSAGVQRQYPEPPAERKTPRSACSSLMPAARGRTLIDRRLYLPTSWTEDRERCQAAGIEDTIGFETKVVMAKAMVRRAITDRIPFRWVTADAAYGFSKGWRSRARAGRRLPRHGHHPARHRRHPLGHRPPRPRPVPRAAPAEVEAPFLRKRRPRATASTTGRGSRPGLGTARTAGTG
ncbi:transposase [Streptomyces sp. CA-243310]|uniref:transposase n=1 Tax=Streptomyces sp. CA-243310 TaxID=3240056 RepID=UPI003D8FED98